MNRVVLSSCGSMQTSKHDLIDLKMVGVSADLPIVYRLSFAFGALALHVLVFALFWMNVEGEAGATDVVQPEAEEIIFYVETVLPPVQEEVAEESFEEVIEDTVLEVEEEAEAEAEVIEQAPEKVQKPQSPKPRLSVVKPQMKPARPKPVQKKLQTIIRAQQTKSTKPGFIKPSFPSYLKNPPPKYPKIAKRRRMEGVTRLWVKVSEKGTVLSLKIHQSSGHARLDQEALKAVKHWRFISAKKQGYSVVGEVIVPIRFQLKPAS